MENEEVVPFGSQFLEVMEEAPNGFGGSSVCTSYTTSYGCGMTDGPTSDGCSYD